MVDTEYPMQVIFYRTSKNNEPVREWIKKLPRNERKIIGGDIKTVQFGWPIGMPLVKKVSVDLWEIRSKLDNRISRILFTVYGDFIVLIHGFIKNHRKFKLRI